MGGGDYLVSEVRDPPSVGFTINFIIDFLGRGGGGGGGGGEISVSHPGEGKSQFPTPLYETLLVALGAMGIAVSTIYIIM